MVGSVFRPLAPASSRLERGAFAGRLELGPPEPRAGHAGRRGRAVLAGLALAALGRAQSAVPLTFDPAEVNFGTKAQGLTVTAEVRMTNTAAKELHVLNVSSDCSCTAGQPKRERLAPGESTTIPVTLQTKSFLGPLVRRLTVHTTEGDGELRVRVTIRPFAEWEVVPNPVVLPTSRRDQEVEAPLTAVFQGTGTHGVLEATADQPWLRAELAAAGPGPGSALRVRKLPAAPAGPQMGSVTLTTDDPNQPRLTVRVYAPVTSAVKITPNPVILPTTRVGAVATREFVVSGWEEVAPPVPALVAGRVESRGRRPDGDYVFAVAVTPTAPGMNTFFVRLTADAHDVLAEVPVVVKAEAPE